MNLLLYSVIQLSLVVRVLHALLPLQGVPPGVARATVDTTVRELSTLRSPMMTLQVRLLHTVRPRVAPRSALTPLLLADLVWELRT